MNRSQFTILLGVATVALALAGNPWVVVAGACFAYGVGTELMNS